EDLAHHLDQALLGDSGRHVLRVVVRQCEEQRVLVVEVVEDRPPAQAGGLLETPPRAALEPVLGKADACARQDLSATSVHVVLTDPGHETPSAGETPVVCSCGRSTDHDRTPLTGEGSSWISPSPCFAARTAGCHRCGSRPPHRGCRCARWRRTPPSHRRRRWRRPWPSWAWCPR